MYLNNLRKAVLGTILINAGAWVLTTLLFVAAVLIATAFDTMGPMVTAAILNNEQDMLAQDMLLTNVFACYHLLLIGTILWLNNRQRMSYSGWQLATILGFLVGPLAIIGGDVGKFVSTPLLMSVQLLSTFVVLLAVFTAKQQSTVTAGAKTPD